MNQFVRPDRKCPNCNSGDYQFRGRRTIDANLDQGGGRFVETKYLCKQCDKLWKEQVLAAETKAE